MPQFAKTFEEYLLPVPLFHVVIKGQYTSIMSRSEKGTSFILATIEQIKLPALLILTSQSIKVYLHSANGLYVSERLYVTCQVDGQGTYTLVCLFH